MLEHLLNNLFLWNRSLIHTVKSIVKGLTSPFEAAISPVKFANVSQSVSTVLLMNFPTRAHAIRDSAKAAIEHPSAM